MEGRGRRGRANWSRARQLAGVSGRGLDVEGPLPPSSAPPCTPLTRLPVPSSVGLFCWTHLRLPTRPSLAWAESSALLGTTTPGLCEALGLGELEGGTRQPQPCFRMLSSQHVLAHVGTTGGGARQTVLKTPWPLRGGVPRGEGRRDLALPVSCPEVEAG